MDALAYVCNSCASIWLREVPLRDDQLDIIPCPTCRTQGSLRAHGRVRLQDVDEKGMAVPETEGEQTS